MNAIIRKYENAVIGEAKAKALAAGAATYKGDEFAVGDTVDVHVRISEGEKERIQVFQGLVISRSGTGMNSMFTVRRLVSGEGVERVFPLHAPRVEKIEVLRRGRTRRAKLYYLRDRVGRATRLREENRPSRKKPRNPV